MVKTLVFVKKKPTTTTTKRKKKKRKKRQKQKNNLHSKKLHLAFKLIQSIVHKDI